MFLSPSLYLTPLLFSMTVWPTSNLDGKDKADCAGGVTDKCPKPNENPYLSFGGKKSRRKTRSSKKSHRKSSKKQRKSRRGGKSRRGRR